MCDKGERVCDCELVSERESYDFHRERDISNFHCDRQDQEVIVLNNMV